MPRVTWLLRNEMPVIVVHLRDSFGFSVRRTLLADTGAGPRHAPFELVLSQSDCQRFGGLKIGEVSLGGAVTGSHFIYPVQVEIPALAFDDQLAAVAAPAPQLPQGLDGIAAFRLLNAFSDGNFGDATQFGLEAP